MSAVLVTFYGKSTVSFVYMGNKSLFMLIKCSFSGESTYSQYNFVSEEYMKHLFNANIPSDGKVIFKTINAKLDATTKQLYLRVGDTLEHLNFMFDTNRVTNHEIYEAFLFVYKEYTASILNKSKN